MRNRLFNEHTAGIWITVLTIVALCLRLALIPTRLLAENDGPYYVALAAQIMRGEWSGALNDYWSQFYPLTIAGLGLITHNPELAARLVSALCGAALVPAVWWLTTEISNSVAAFIAALLTLFQPWLLVFSALALTEMLFALCMVTALALILYAGRKGSVKSFALAGGVTGLAILTRPEGALLIAAIVVMGVLHVIRHRGWRSARKLAVALITMALVIAPQSIGTYQLYGHLNLAWKSSVNVALGEAFTDPTHAEQAVYRLDEQGNRHLVNQAGQTSISEYWLRHAGDALRRVRANLLLIWQDHMMATVLPMPWDSAPAAFVQGLLAFLGLAVGLRGSKRGALLGVVAFMAAYGVGLLSVLVHSRLLVPLAPFMLCFIAMGVSQVISIARQMFGQIRQPDWRRYAGYSAVIVGVVGLCIIAAMSYAWAYTRQDPFSAEPVVQKEAGQWLHANAPPTAKIMSHNPQIPLYFYDGWPFDHALPVPWASPEEVVEYARRQAVSYIVLEEWMIRAAHFPIEAWLDQQYPYPGYHQLQTFGTAPERVIIYERRD